MVTQAPRQRAVTAAIAFTLSCIGLMIFVWTQFGGTIPFAPQGYRVKATFAESGLLVPGADVRISGVNVGRVVSVASRGTNSLVTMDISQQYAPIPADTRAILRLKTLLGEAYVELSSGTRAGPALHDGGTIPLAQVQGTQQLDQVLSAFGKPSQRNLQAFLAGSATSLAGEAANLSSALGNLDPATADLQQIVSTLDGEQGDVRSLLRGSADVLGTLGQRSADLETLIGAGDQVLSATAARNAQLRATVDALPAFLAGLRSTLAETGTSLSLAKPSLDALQPVTPMLEPVLRDLITLSGPAVAVLHQAPRLLHDATVALPAMTRFNRAFHPALDTLLPAVRQLVPVIDFIDLYRSELTAAMANLAAGLEATAPAETASGSASYLRSLAEVSNESFFGQTVREPTNRENAYFAPGELANLGRGGLESASCANTANRAQSPLGFANVRCRVEPGFRWGGLTRYFPHVTAGSSQR
jgi:virulence factor Mce-like protein